MLEENGPLEFSFLPFAGITQLAEPMQVILPIGVIHD